MTHTKLQLLGTEGDGWRASVQNLLKGSSATVQLVAGEGDALLAKPDAEVAFLVIVESPVSALAAFLQANPAEDIHAWVGRWVARGQRLMRLLQERHRQCLFIHQADAVRHPDAFVAALKAHFGVEFAPPVATPPLRPLDPVGEAIARAALTRQPPMWAVAAELDAACQPLADDVAPSTAESAVRPQGLLADLSLAWGSYARIERQWQQALEREEEQQAANASTRELLEGELARAREELALAQAERDAGRQSMEASTVQQEVARSQLAATEAENRQLLFHLHEVQELLEAELGSGRERAARVEALDGARYRAGAAEMSIQAMEFGAGRDEAPYREFDMRLLGVRTGSEAPRDHDIRLVEHRGHPGLVVFSDPAGPPIFGAWQETGREGDRRFMLLVPNDAAGAGLLDRLPRTDHHRLTRMLANVERALEDAPAHAHWLALARRLRVEILERDARFRYDDIRISPVKDEPTMLEVEFHAVEFGARQWSKLRVRWQPGDANPMELRLSDVPGDMPPLKGWTGLSDDGALPQSWLVPLADVVGGSARLDAWRRLEPADRQLLVALLDAMPAASLQAIDQGLVAEADNARLLEESHALLRRVPVEPPPSPGRMSRLRALLKTGGRARRPAAAAGAHR